MMVPQLNTIFQNAYVTNDVEQAAALFKDRFATGAFTIIDFEGVMRIGLAFAGRTMIELIQPFTDPAGLYAHWIPAGTDFAVRHHHLGLLVDSKEELAAIRAAHVSAGTAVATEGSLPGALDFLYVDTSTQLGHYLEYVRLDEGGRAMFANVEGSIFTMS
ncbi:VOC family protein [Sphingobium sp. HBC34]|uniref:VOC family protein n=1 Tax=Sphingobium cyanobacteriorum TaxID=3063954 RepID=A0ABT8ZHH0_9SPHN|nr:VOC family protein [Sphingobium sp. HBC34]MDO7833469.1 VOC family protein [Sphingobium sp. HBC34]